MSMNFSEAAEWFKAKAIEVREARQAIELAGAKIVQKEIKDSLGHYHGAVGPFIEWAQLAESTQNTRERQGFTPNDPLLMSGKLRDSIEIVPTAEGTAVGTNIPFAKYLENGTSKMPARPFVGRGAYVKQDEVLEVQSNILGEILKS